MKKYQEGQNVEKILKFWNIIERLKIFEKKSRKVRKNLVILKKISLFWKKNIVILENKLTKTIEILEILK